MLRYQGRVSRKAWSEILLSLSHLLCYEEKAKKNNLDAEVTTCLEEKREPMVTEGLGYLQMKVPLILN